MLMPMSKAFSVLSIALLLTASPASAQFFGFPPTPGSQPQYRDQPYQQQPRSQAPTQPKSPSPAQSKGEWDCLTITSTVSAADGFRPLPESECRLVRA